MKADRIGPAALVTTACLIFSIFVITLGRVPTPWPDAQLYASIARSVQLHGNGVPSTIWFSPAAVDHLPFYGPVYFTLTSLAFSVFGFSVESSKLAGLLGVLLTVTGVAMLARSLSRERTRWLWAVVLVLLTPEIGAAATSGDMETLVAGFELIALAVYVRGLLGRTRPVISGAIAGGCVLLAALTTPRTYPFVAAFFVCGCAMTFVSRHRSSVLTQLAIAAGVFVAGFLAWTVAEHGGPVQWAQNVIFILTREDTDVAPLETATRVLAFNWSSAVTPVAALVGATLGCWHLAREFRRDSHEQMATVFALATTVAGGVLIVWGMNITFSLGVYFAVPVFAVVLALPRRTFSVPAGVLIAFVSTLLAADLAVAGVRYARVAATWAARDPVPLTEFLRLHVPAGSSVAGPNALYFFPVEAIGAHYRSFSPESHADWARWATRLDAFAPPADRRVSPGPEGQKFFIWQTGDDLPQQYRCALRVASYAPPPIHLNRLGPFGGSWDIGFPATDVYRLPLECPVGYDPTGTRAE